MEIVEPKQDLARSPSERFRKQNSTGYFYLFALLSLAIGILFFPMFLEPEDSSVWVWVPSPPQEFSTLNGSWLMDHWVSVLSSHTLYAKSLQSCLILCDSMDCSPPGSSVHGIHWARILEWVAIPFCRDSSQAGIEPGSLHFRWILYHLSRQESPHLSFPNSLKLQCSQGKADKTFM